MRFLSKIKGIFLACLLFSITAFIVLIMRIFPAKQRSLRRVIAKIVRTFVGYKVEFEGEFDPSSELFVLNHQSLLDILIFDEFHPGDIKWVAKRELGKVPLLGAGFRSGACILIDRSNPREIVHIIKQTSEFVERGGAVAIFPEGTRGSGKKLLKFQSGAQIIANKLGLKVQPVLIIGSKEIIDSKKLAFKSGRVKVVFLPSFVAYEDSEWLTDLREQMQKILDEKLGKNNSINIKNI